MPVNLSRTNRGKENEEVKTEVDVIRSPLTETVNELRKHWAFLMREKHFHTLAHEVLAREMPKYTHSALMNPANLTSLARECKSMLTSTTRIFEAAVEGTLTRRLSRSRTLQREHADLIKQASEQPSIYIHQLADDDGQPPSANQLLLIRDAVLSYVGGEEHELANLVDNVVHPAVPRQQTIKGYRKYVCSSVRKPSPDRIFKALKLCDGLRRRWAETPESERGSPLAFPPGECGYSINSKRRLEQHRRHSSSNYLMNLTEAICAVLFEGEKLPALFRMQQYIIFLIFKPGQAELAEIFCSGLLQVWIDNGGGFNHHPAGLSNRSAAGVSEGRWRDFEWEAMKRTILEEYLSVEGNSQDGAMAASAGGDADYIPLQGTTSGGSSEGELKALSQSIERLDLS